MIDIIVFALPVDKDRAAAIVDGLVARDVVGANRTRFIAEHPRDAGWSAAVRSAEACPCVIFCWSRSTFPPDAEPLTRLAQRVFAADHAISVELDEGARPASLLGCTTYPLHGWRAQTGGWRRFVHGNGFVTQIAAAAQQKVLGRDPPPPSAYWRMVRAQAWIALGALAFVIGSAAGLLQFYRDPAFAKWLDPQAAAAFEAARASDKPCDALRAFGQQHNGSAWSGEASELLATCTVREIVRTAHVETKLEVFGATAAEAQSDGDRKCATLATNTNAVLKSVKIESFIPLESGTATCSLDQPTSNTKETIGTETR